MSVECTSCEGPKKVVCESVYRREALKLAGLVDLVIDISDANGKLPTAPVHEREVTLGSLEFMAQDIACRLTPDEIREKLDLELTSV